MTTTPDKLEVRTHVAELIAKLKVYAKTEFDVNVDILRPVITFNICNRKGWGGIDKIKRPVMRLNLGEVVSYPVVGYSEYASLARNPAIGSFYSTNWKHWVSALVIHEFAHVIQFSLPHSNSKLKKGANFYERLGRHEGGHGYFFQRTYKILRDEFLNAEIERPAYGKLAKDFEVPADQVAAKKDYSTCHYLVGKNLLINSTVYTVLGLKTSNRKYPIIAVSKTGRRVKMSVDFAENSVIRTK